jgi:protein TonB
MEGTRAWLSGPPTQTSLFHSELAAPDRSVLPELWEILLHPIRSFREERRAPRTRASLFHFSEKPEDAAPLDWRDLLKDLFTSYRFASFIPSLWSNHEELAEERAQMRTRRMESGFASMAVHGLMAGLAVLVAFQPPAQPAQQKDAVVYIRTPLYLPPIADGRDGGGGGGGGKRETLPPSGGRLPEAAPLQLVPPDPGMPKPLQPSDNPLDAKPSVQIPIDLPADLSMPIGDITGPLGGPTSSGPGSGGGIGNGSGSGDGSGKGPGAGTGEDGGLGAGKHGGLGDRDGLHGRRDDLTLPEILVEPTPYYTEEARKARKEGIVLLEAVIRANGTVDGFKIVRGLGYGLDESAIQTIAGRWKFKPATFRGVPIDFSVSIEVTFRLY